jgi:rhodanese-related sulfurtransferase
MYMRTIAKIAGLALTLSASPVFAQQAATPPVATATPVAPSAPTVTPANDPAYNYKTLRINRAAFDALSAKPEQLVVLDIRRPDELTKFGGFPAYLSIQTADIQRSLPFIPHDRLIVVVSNRAHRAGAIGDLLAGYGFHVVGAIGVLDYQDEGGVLTKIVPPPPRAVAATGAPNVQAQAQTAAPSQGANQ